MEQTQCSETSAYKIQMPGNYAEENIQHTEHGESLKSRTHEDTSYKTETNRKATPTVVCLRYLTDVSLATEARNANLKPVADNAK